MKKSPSELSSHHKELAFIEWGHEKCGGCMVFLSTQIYTQDISHAFKKKNIHCQPCPQALGMQRLLREF
jgi:hypothetical protein